MGFSDAATISSPTVSFSGFFSVIVLIVFFVILYYVVRTAVREGILAAWRIRNRAEKEARDDQAQGW
jgi:hypothetical protein